MVVVHMGHSFGFGSEIRNFLQISVPYATRDRQTHGGTLANTHSSQKLDPSTELSTQWLTTIPQRMPAYCGAITWSAHRSPHT